MRISTKISALALMLGVMPGHAAARQGASAYLTPDFHAGARYDNVFSRTIALQAEGFDESVRRVSGSASTGSWTFASPGSWARQGVRR